MRFDVIINSASGSGQFSRPDERKRLEEAFAAEGIEARIQVVPPDRLDETLVRAIDGSADAIVMGGGDGSIASTAGKIAGTSKALGILPLGTFNLEARDLGIPLAPIAAATNLSKATVREIDLLRINGLPCLCTVVLGFYPALAKLRQEIHGKFWWLKSARIPLEMLTVATRTPVLQLEVEVEGRKETHKTLATAFSPGEYADEFGIIPHRPDLSSGLVYSYISQHLTKSALMRLSAGYLLGRLFQTEGLTVLKGSAFKISARNRKRIPAMIDGEILMLDLPCEIRVAPEKLSVLVPPAS